MSTISNRQLVAAGQPAGATALSLVTELVPAGGPHAGIVPACFAPGRSTPILPDQAAYQTRLVDGEPALTVLIDHKRSQLDRVEAAVLQCIRDGQPPLSRVPRVEVRYDPDSRSGRTVYTDLELPQRVFDAQIRDGTVDGVPVTTHPTYRALCDASAEDARAVLETSPGSLVFGAWDFARSSRARWYRSALAGEILGVLADQSGGAREAGVNAQLRRRSDVVSCSRIIRTQVLNFAVLRQLRFDSGPAGDAACRALLAAYALAGLARANADLIVRTDCDLVEAGPTAMKLDARDGAFVALEPPSIEQADELLECALDEARREADIQWCGQVFAVAGDPTRCPAAGVDEPGGGPADRRVRPFWRPRLLTGR